MSKELRYYQKEAHEATLKAMDKGGDKLIWAMATGTGKTKCSVSFIEKLKKEKNFGRVLWGSHTEELIEQSAIALLAEMELMPYNSLISTIANAGGLLNLLRNGQMLSETDYHNIICENIGVVKADVFDINKPIVVASMQTLWRRLDKIPENHFDIVIADECFPAGTLIEGFPIERICAGMNVKSFNHSTGQIEIRRVLHTFKTPIHRKMIKLFFENNQSFTCTENHPIFTKEFGYITAKDLSLCDKQVSVLSIGRVNEKKISIKVNTISELRKLRKTLLSKTFIYRIWSMVFKKLQSRNQKENLDSTSSNLSYLWNSRIADWEKAIEPKQNRSKFYLFFNRMQEKIFKNRSAKSNKNENEEWIWRKIFDSYEEKQSNVDSRSKRKNDQFNERKNFSFSWRKWSINKSTDDVAFSDWIRNGICYFVIICKTIIQECSQLLQSRFSLSRSKISDRGGRQIPSFKEMEILRQKEDGNPKFIRLDGYQIYEQRSRTGNKEMRKEDYVYNFEVEGNNNYFVDSILVHNCHLFGANTFKKSLDYFKPKLRLGLSATPYRMDGMLMGDIFDQIVYTYPIEKAIEEGYLCEIDAVRVKTEAKLDNVKTVAGDLNQKELEVIVNTPERNQLIVDRYKEYASGRQFIAFCVDVQHAMDLNAKFNENGVFTNFIVGNKDLTPDRRNIIELFKKGHYTGLTNCMVLTAGFDHPNVGCVIMAAPTKSLTKYIQQIGRGTRLKDENYVTRFKQEVVVLDIVDVTSKHRLINTWTLDKGKTLEEKTFITKQKKLDLIAQRDVKIKLNATKKDTRVNLLKLPKVKISDSIRMQEPASEKQLAWIAKSGYDIVNTNYTKAMCSEIISNLPATESQVWRLAKEGYDVSQGVTIAEAKLAFVALDEKKAKENYQKTLSKNNFPFTDLS